MSNQKKQQKSKGVVLCRSKQQPDGKEIQGLVFDHPSMPKIVTISSAARKKSSSGNNPNGHRPRKEQNPTGAIDPTGEIDPIGHQARREQNPTGEKYTTGEKYPTGGKHPTEHRPHEQYPTGHFTRQYAARHSVPQPTTTEHYTPGQYTVHRTQAQHPSRSSPPALIRAPTQYSTHRHISAGDRQFHGHLPKPAERITEGSRSEIPPQGEKSQISFPSYYRNGPSVGIPLPATVPAAHNTQFHYPQHETSSPRTQETTIRRNSTGALQHHPENSVQHRENVVQHSQNIAENSIELGTDEFSRDFHLNVWRESHKRAMREWTPPIRRLDQLPRDPPVHSLGPPAHLPLTSGHIVDGTVPRYRSFSTGAGFRGERGDNLSHQLANPQLRGASVPSKTSATAGQYGNNTRSPNEVRRYSTGYIGSPYTEDCTTRSQNSPEKWTYGDYSPRVRSAEGANARVSSAGSIRRLSNIADEYIPVVRDTEGRNSRVVNSDHLRSSSSNSSEDYNPVVRNAEGRNLEVLNAGNLRTSSNTSEDYNQVVRSAEGRNLEVSSMDKIGKSSSLSNETEPQANIQRRRRRIKRQHVPTVVVISDSDDEEMKISTPFSNEECDQDVFTVEPNNQAGEPNPDVRGSPGSESEEACIITKVKGPGDKSEQLVGGHERVSCESPESTGSRKAVQESRAYDVNNNESGERVRTSNEQRREGMGMSNEQSREGVGASYRTVLYQREVAGQSGTQRVIMSEQLLFDKNNRGTKRLLEDKSQYFVAGSVELAGSSLDDAARKIRRISCHELDSKNAQTRPSSDSRVDINTRHQSSQDKYVPVNSGENFKPKLTRSHDDMPKLVRSRSENDKQIKKEKFKSERSTSLTYLPSTFSNQQEIDCVIKPDVTKKVEQTESCKFSSKTPSETKPHCNVCSDGTICVVRVPEVLPESEASGFVSRDEIRCRNCDRVLNEYRSPGSESAHTVVKLPKSGPKPTGIVVGIKQAPEVEQPLESEIVGSENEQKRLLQFKAAALEGSIYVIHQDDDLIYKDKISSKVSDDLDVLHFNVVKKDSDVTWTNSKDHVKSTTSSRDQVHPSQQWQAYSLKLEQEQVAKISCGKEASKLFNIKRNSWEELKKKFASEEKKFSEGKRDCVPCSDATRKRAHCGENALETSCRKSYKFHDATKKLSDEYKRRKLSDGSETDCSSNSSVKVSESEVLVSRGTCENNTEENTDTQGQAITTSSDYHCVQITKTPTKIDAALVKTGGEISNVDSTETASPKTQEFSPSEDKPFEVNTPESNPPEENTREKDPYDIQFSDIRPFERTSWGKEPQTVQIPQKEELSLQEWTEILQGRITQVKESIEEEKTPWKTKNKKKVLEKLENHLTWLTGPTVDETIFIARKLQFFQTMRKQYELMNKIKTQRHTMKCSDSTPQVSQNVEKPKAKAAKEVVVPKKAKEVKKTAKCRPKSVKNTEGSMMKKIRKAVLS